eukprot:TRINITY_DN2989_c0_g1_i1.p1 TRINITY_DN2989_c0_g1~~TRINITY_DN2989_c0_g1_i1.p1  ORF type:complete len:766 (-),score=192.71 TRINITY_DN2989_c0_g1_i1:81-2348(-)
MAELRGSTPSPPPAATNDEDVEYWRDLRGILWKQKRGVFASKEARFFRMTLNGLFWFKDEEAEMDPKGKPMGHLGMHTILGVRSATPYGLNSFELDMGPKSVLLYAVDREVKNLWVKTIEKALYKYWAKKKDGKVQLRVARPMSADLRPETPEPDALEEEETKNVDLVKAPEVEKEVVEPSAADVLEAERRREGKPLTATVMTGLKRGETSHVVVFKNTSSREPIPDTTLPREPDTHLACKHDAVRELETLILVHMADKEGLDQEKETPLHVAAAFGSERCVDFLLGRGVDCTVRDIRKHTPLHLAAAGGFLKLVKRLSERMEDAVMAKDYNGRLPLHLAVMNGQNDVIQFFLDQGTKVNTPDRDKLTPLHLAVIHGQEATVRFLVEKCNANPNAADREGRKPIHYAALTDHVGIFLFLKPLLRHIKVGDAARKAIIHYASEGGSMSILKMLIEELREPIEMVDDDNRTALHYACRMGRENVVQYLLAHKARLEARDRWKEVPMHLAADGGHIKIIEMLFAAGAKLDAVNEEGRAPLHFASYHGNSEVVDFLLKQKVNVIQEDLWKQTPLHGACDQGRVSVARKLIARGAKLDARNEEDRTPLHFAAIGGNAEVVNLLVQKGCDLGWVDKWKQTALHGACARAHLDVIQILVEKGADINARKADGRTPLHFAAARGHLDVVKYLISKAANGFQKDSKGLTPLGLAKIEKHTSTIKYLEEWEAENRQSWRKTSSQDQMQSRRANTSVDKFTSSLRE